MSFRFSDEHLNAYLDNQLDSEERSVLLEALRRDQDLAARVCKLQKVQDMVQLAYHNVATEQSSGRPGHRWQLYFAQAATALLILGLGLTIGWYSNNALNRPASLFELAQSAQIATQPQPNDELKLMLHVNSDDPHRLKNVLDEAEYLLNTSSQDHRKIRIEILTNGKGLKLLQKNNSEYAQKVSSLSQDYQNVQFMACRIAINRYRKEHGVSIQLLPNVQIVPSAMEEALSRQREGWTYLRI
jgi:intracellular sulfur oxidation DsrE/DsrF family protein